jgi:hypothetical protein
MTEHKETIYIVDQIVPKPGKGKEVLDTYMAKYAPAARAERGMTLVHQLVSPPMWLDEQSNTLTIIWTVQGAPAWWNMSFHGRRNPDVAGFWESIKPLIVSRHRSFSAEVADLGSLADV